MKGILNKQGQMDRWTRDAWDVYTYNAIPVDMGDGTFNLYYQCYGVEGNANSGPAVVVSDSINGPWTKPNVGEIEYPSSSGDKDNNLVIWRDSTGGVPYEWQDVIHDGTRYIALGMQKATAQTQLWSSPDGFVWTWEVNAFTGADLNGGEYAEPKSLHFDGATYRIYYRSMPSGTPQRRSIGFYASTSPFSGYADQGFLSFATSTAATLQYYDCRMFEYEGAWWMNLVLYNSVTQVLGPHLLYRSTDGGVTFEQRGMLIEMGYVDPDGFPYAVSTGEFDSSMLTAAKPIAVGGNLYFIYGASAQAHDTWPRTMEYGMATASGLDKQYDSDLQFYAPFAATGQLLPLIGPAGACTRAGSGRTYYDRGGKLEYAAANVAVLDHDPNTGESLGLSIFEGITSLMSQPEDLSHADWTADGLTVDANVAEHVDNNISMDRIAVTAANVVHRIFDQTVSNASQFHDVSAFFKDDGARFVGLNLLGATNDWATVVADLELGTIAEFTGATTGWIDDSGIELLSDGRYCVWMVAGVSAANAFVIPQLHSSLAPSLNTAGNEVFLGVLGEDAYINGVTCHQAKYHRPYAPSSPALDVIDFSDVSWYDDTVGTWYIDLTPARIDVDSFAFELGASVNDSITFWFDQPSGTVSIFRGTTTGNDGLIQIASAAVKGTRLKIAIAYANNDMVAYIDGVAGTPDTVVTLPPTNAATWMTIGRRFGDISPFCGLIHDLRYFDVRKADAVVERMSNGLHGPVPGVGGGAKAGGAGFGKMGGLGKL